MASGYSVYVANLINDHILKSGNPTVAPTTPAFVKTDGSTVAVPAIFYIALFKAGATTYLRNDDLAGAIAASLEVSGGSYSRLAIKSGAGSSRIFSASSAGLSENTTAWAWSASTGVWGTITAAAIVDVSSGSAGHVWYYGDLGTAKYVATPDVFRFLSGAFDVQS